VLSTWKLVLSAVFNAFNAVSNNTYTLQYLSSTYMQVTVRSRGGAGNAGLHSSLYSVAEYCWIRSVNNEVTTKLLTV
jgi:hypothetical protein